MQANDMKRDTLLEFSPEIANRFPSKSPKKTQQLLDLVLPHFAEVALLINWIPQVGQRIFLFPIPKPRSGSQ